MTIPNATVAALRALFNRPPLLPCSTVVFVDDTGRRWRIRDVLTQTPRDDGGKPTGIPVAVTILEPDGW